MQHIMTVDLEDWFHCFEEDNNCWNLYEDRIVPVTHSLLDIFEKFSVTATFFILGDIAIKHPNLILEIKDKGHEIGCHGSSHRLIYTQTKEDFTTDVLEAKNNIENIIGVPVVSYRAPFFSITEKSLWALDILKSIGIKYDSSIFPILNHRYGIVNAKRFPNFIIDELLELPLSTYKIGLFNIPFSGGAYFRIFPFPLTRFMFSSYEVNKEPIIFYLHPWELDINQPRIQRYSFQGIRHYWNLDMTVERLEKLINEYSFTSIRDFYES